MSDVLSVIDEINAVLGTLEITIRCESEWHLNLDIELAIAREIIDTVRWRMRRRGLKVTEITEAEAGVSYSCSDVNVKVVGAAEGRVILLRYLSSDEVGKYVLRDFELFCRGGR